MAIPRAGPSLSRSHRLYVPRQPLVAPFGRATPTRSYASAAAPGPSPAFGRLRHAAPYVFWWLVLCALASGHVRMNEQIRLDRDKWDRQEDMVRRLQGRVRRGEQIGDEELQRELELIGLREKQVMMGSSELRAPDASWKQVLLGQKKNKKKAKESKDAEKDADESIADFLRALEEGPKPQTSDEPVQAKVAVPEVPLGRPRRAPSVDVFIK